METATQLERDIRYRVAMREIENMPVSIALATGKGVKCPVCGLIHPGIFVPKPYCSEKCAERER